MAVPKSARRKSSPNGKNFAPVEVTVHDARKGVLVVYLAEIELG